MGGLSTKKMMNLKVLLLYLTISATCIFADPQSGDSNESIENVSLYSGPPFNSDKSSATLQRRSSFGPPQSSFEDFKSNDEDSRESVKTASSHNRPPYLPEENYPSLHLRNQIPHSQPKPQPKPVQQYLQPVISQTRSKPPTQYKKPLNLKNIEEEEDQTPDRLTELLPRSNFNCLNKQTGYYADESLGCEVFHYCQENARHSWICPEGFTFHQLHLICMPPSKENICTESSKFHIVNDYLYKPVNLEEHQRKPNVTLRYHERYYPEEYHQYPENDYDDELQQRRPHVSPTKQHHTQVVRRPTQIPQFQATIRPETNIGQVYRSPEDINIPLEHRRPPQYFPQRYLIPE
ncbi:uncharacterized protein LOC108732390 isoform X5 [Agrilus planipennis]|uniref:Uncharacterized protein LOC108732390 isoform X5 n=1 Tax=Agrilus planipennis TaxID=224129 RepID=A0A1W4WEX3_AGRPL|nr:uncharacterized protein LOC108732390 isoform X5 [Agrilus planipennis]